MFAPTVQGEGIHAGQLVGFIRLANCNLACSWCDTPYSWDWQRYDKALETFDMDVADVADVINGWNVERIILTGGEPLMQQEQLITLIQMCNDKKFDVETNGTIAPVPALANLVDFFNVSPKLSHSGDPLKKRIKENALQAFNLLALQNKAAFKFVCKQPADLQEVEQLVNTYELNKKAVWIMPEGTTTSDVTERLQILADDVVKYGYNLTARLHVLAWGGRRAV